MVKEDLRIGNLVTDEFFDSFSKAILVESIGPKGINISPDDDGKPYGMHLPTLDYEYEFENLRGIPLTYEWLKRLGAIETYNKNTFGIKFSKYSLHTLYVTITDKDNIATIGDSFSGKENLCVFTGQLVNHVHQLQNLFYALTGEELTFNRTETKD